jgi:predicted transcriptional regulator YdeE
LQRPDKNRAGQIENRNLRTHTIEDMNYETITMRGFSIIGIAVRTTNQNGQSQKDVAELWGKFMGQGLSAQIPNKASDDIYCVYTDYESDFTGTYTTILGCKVTSLDEIPEGFEGKEIPEAMYKRFQAKGSLPDCVGKVWGEIWQSGIDRTYIADFDVYSEKSSNPFDAEVAIYVS